MSTPPSTTFDFLLTGIRVGWSFVAWCGVSTFDRKPSVRRRSLAVAVLAGSVLAGLGLLVFTLLRWGFLDPLVGYDGPVYRRAFPFIAMDLLGLLVALDGLRRVRLTGTADTGRFA